MRSSKLITAITAAISLLVLVPSSAFAHKHPSRNGHCVIGVDVSPHEIAAGDQVVVFGRLRCFGAASAANQEVKLFHHLFGSPGSSFVQSTTTDAHGFYEIPNADGVVETNRSYYVLSHGARSATKPIRV